MHGTECRNRCQASYFAIRNNNLVERAAALDPMADPKSSFQPPNPRLPDRVGTTNAFACGREQPPNRKAVARRQRLTPVRIAPIKDRARCQHRTTDRKSAGNLDLKTTATPRMAATATQIPITVPSHWRSRRCYF
jgi:hypothetical protein